MTDKKPGNRKPVVKELPGAKDLRLKDQVRKERDAAAAGRMEAMNMNPTMTVREVFDPAGNKIQTETEIAPRQSSSISLEMDSKGNIKPKVKVYHESASVAKELAVKIMTELLDELGKLGE